MATEKQISANRLNGTKSIGPITQKGKEIVSKNALSHGLLSSVTLLSHENKEEFERFRTSMFVSLAPLGELENTLAERIISTCWRLRRVIRIESFMMEYEPEYFGTSFTDKKVFHLLDGSEHLLRYETAFERSLFKTLHELQRLQAARKGVEVPIPAVVDLDISTGRT